ncbi:MAG: hypothetical protein U5J62_09000 [Desulfurivibrio sp.]|nr:hypothetical protein [Desulfurivibrio sp.]
MKSTGEFPGPDSGNMNVSRTVTYWFYDATTFIAVQEEEGFTGEGDLVDSDMGLFGEGPGQGDGVPLGSYEQVNEDGGDALQLQGMNPSGGAAMNYTSLLYQGGIIDTADYEVQVKIKLADTWTPPTTWRGSPSANRRTSIIRGSWMLTGLIYQE